MARQDNSIILPSLICIFAYISKTIELSFWLTPLPSQISARQFTLSYRDSPPVCLTDASFVCYVCNLGKTIQNCLPETTFGFQDNFLLSSLLIPSTAVQQDNYDCLADCTSSSPSATPIIFTHTNSTTRFSSFRVKNLLVSVYSSYTLAGLV